MHIGAIPFFAAFLLLTVHADDVISLRTTVFVPATFMQKSTAECVMWALWHNKTKMIETLLLNGTRLDQHELDCALILTVEKNDLDAVRLLLAAGADYNAPCDELWPKLAFMKRINEVERALELARANDHEEIEGLLLEHLEQYSLWGTASSTCKIIHYNVYGRDVTSM